MANTDAHTSAPTETQCVGNQKYFVDRDITTEHTYPNPTPVTPATPTYIEKLIRTRSDGFNGQGPETGLLLAYMPCDGEVVSLLIRTTVITGSIDAKFNLVIAGEPVWEDEEDMLTVAPGETVIELEVGVEALEADTIRLDLFNAANLGSLTAMIVEVLPS